MHKRLVFITIACTALLYACQQPVPTGYQATRTITPENMGDSTAYLVADSILYDVVVQNPDSTDEWASYCLRNVDKKTIADMVFDGIYSGKLQAYAYSNEQLLSIEQVKEMEKDPRCNRSKIGKIQFEEQWFMDQVNLGMYKKVTAIMLAYEINAIDGRYRAGIKVKLPNTAN